MMETSLKCVRSREWIDDLCVPNSSLLCPGLDSVSLGDKYAFPSCGRLIHAQFCSGVLVGVGTGQWVDWQYRLQA